MVAILDLNYLTGGVIAMTARLIFTFWLCCSSAAVLADTGFPSDAWRPLPERSLQGATLPLQINLLSAGQSASADRYESHRALSPVSRALANEQDDEGELKRRAEKRIEVQYGQDRWQVKLRRRGIFMKMLFD